MVDFEDTNDKEKQEALNKAREAHARGDDNAGLLILNLLRLMNSSWDAIELSSRAKFLTDQWDSEKRK